MCSAERDTQLLLNYVSSHLKLARKARSSVKADTRTPMGKGSRITRYSSSSIGVVKYKIAYIAAEIKAGKTLLNTAEPGNEKGGFYNGRSKHRQTKGIS